MKIDNRRLAFVLVLGAFIFGVLALFYWDFVRDTIAFPIYYLFWVGDLVLRSISQGVYLALLVLISIVIGVNTVLGIRAGRPRASMSFTHRRRRATSIGEPFAPG